MGFDQHFLKKNMEKHDFPMFFQAASAAAAAEAAAAAAFDACLGSFACGVGCLTSFSGLPGLWRSPEILCTSGWPHM